MPALRSHLAEMRDAAARRARALELARLAELDALIDRCGAPSAGGRGRLRRAVRPRPRHVAAPVRARARRLARPRPGDDRPRPDLRAGRPRARAGRAARLPAGGAGVRLDPAGARGTRVPAARWRTSSTPSSARCCSATAPTPACSARCSNWPGEKAQAVKLPAEAALDESWAEPLAFDGCSTEGPGPARPAATDPASCAQRNAHTRSSLMNVAFTTFCSASIRTSASRCS